MPAMFCAFSGAPDPIAITLGPSGTIGALVQADETLTWSDATTGTIPAIASGNGNTASSAYGGVFVDGVADVYYLLAIKGASVPVLIKEKDIPNADTILGGSPTWAKWRRIVNGSDHPTPQP